MANNVPKYSSFENGSFTGRTKILLDFDYVNNENIRDVLEKALQIHNLNRVKIDYLWNY